MTDATGTTTRAYDAFNRTTSKTVPYFGTSTYAYDITTGIDVGCTAQTTTDPNTNVTRKIYDRVGRLWQVTADGKTTTYTYNNNGSVKNVVYSDGSSDVSSEDYTYTCDNLLDTLTNTKADGSVIDSYSYTYDAAHNMLSKTDSRGITTYAYDRFNRLVSVTEPSGKTTSYTFDAAGNRKTQTVVLGTDTTITTYTYDSQNRLTGTQEQKNGVTTETVVYTYDNNGNQLSKTSTSYIAGVAQTPVVEQTNIYDLFNQLISTVTSTGVTVINIYNGDGRRVGKSVNGTSNDSSTRYLYEYDRVVLEVSVSGIQTGRNVYGINLLTRQVGGDTLIYMYNGHADVTALLSITGLIAATYYYDAFGNILDQTGTVSNNILYAGYQYDTETGLYYLNARMYDPVTARFMQEDTYAGEYNDPLSLNLYTYCKNEPIRYSDPTGHNTLDDYAYQKQEPYHPADGYTKNSNNSIKKQQQQVKNSQRKLEMMEKSTETPAKAKAPTLSALAKVTTLMGIIGSLTYNSEITEGSESVLFIPLGPVKIKNTSIASVTISSDINNSSIFSSNYSTTRNNTTGEIKESLKFGLFGLSANATFDDGSEIGCGPFAIGKTKDKEYGTISFGVSDNTTQTIGVGQNKIGDVVLIGKTEYSSGGLALSNTTEVTADPRLLISLGAKFALDPYAELAKKLVDKASEIDSSEATAGVVIAGGAVAAVAGKEVIPKIIDTLNEKNAYSNGSPFFVIGLEQIWEYISYDSFDASKNMDGKMLM